MFSGERYSLLFNIFSCSFQFDNILVILYDFWHYHHHIFMEELLKHSPLAIAILEPETNLVEFVTEGMSKFLDLKDSAEGKVFNVFFNEAYSKKLFEIINAVTYETCAYKGENLNIALIRDGYIHNYNAGVACNIGINAKGKRQVVIAFDGITSFEEKQRKNNNWELTVGESSILSSTIKLSGRDLIIRGSKNVFFESIDNDQAPVTVGKSLLELIPELDGQEFVKVYRNVLSTGQTFRSDAFKVNRIIKGRKRSIYYNIVFSRLEDADSLYNEVVVVSAVNVTSLILVQNQLSENQELLKQFIESVPVAINICEGSDFVYKIANSVSESIWGYKSPIGKRVVDSAPGIEDRPIYKELTRAFTEGIQITKNGHQYVDQFGVTKYVSYIFQPIRDQHGNVKYIMTIGWDVTDEMIARQLLSESEQNFKNLAEFMPQFVWTADHEGAVTYGNSSWLKFARLNPDQLSDVDAILATFHPDDRNRVQEHWGKCVEEKIPFSLEYQYVDRDNPGKYRWFLTRAIPILNDAGDVSIWIGTSTDIHDVKTLQEQKDSFLGIASHELKTPLTSLRLYSQFIERNLKKSGDTKNAEIAAKMDTQIQKLNNLIVDLLDMTKIQNGKMKLENSIFSFTDLVEEVCTELQMSTSHEIQMGEHDVGTVVADRYRIFQVMSNLIGNAIKYSPDSNRIKVSAELLGDKVKFNVEDFGIGIPSNQLPYVFEQYYRVNSEREDTISGMGIGLFICSEIIKRSGGRIYATSERGKGSTFSFEIPVGKV